MKSQKLRFTISLLTLLITMITNGQNSQQQKDAATIKARIEQFVKDFKSGNGEGFVDVFSDKYYSTEQKAGIIQSISQMAQSYTIDYEIKVDDIKVDRDMAYEIGSYTSTLTPKKQGDAIRETYDFLDVWEREADGKWRITKALKTKK